MAGTSRRPNVVTSPRRDVPTSRRWVNNIKVNKRQHRDVSTSRRLNVATSQRRDVTKSQRRDVTTSQRRDVTTLQSRDVNANSVFSSLKAKRGAELGVSGIVRTRARKSEQQ